MSSLVNAEAYLKRFLLNNDIVACESLMAFYNKELWVKRGGYGRYNKKERREGLQ